MGRLCRLQLQHLLWNIRLEYLLHPSIQIDSAQPLRIADICTGNGSATLALLQHRRPEALIQTHRLWLLELSRQLPSNAELYGFDISPRMFPAQEWLPTNVHLNILDVLGSEFPRDLQGSFNVVHVRALSLVVNDPSDLLRKLFMLLSAWPTPFLHTLLKPLTIGAPRQYDCANADGPSI